MRAAVLFAVVVLTAAAAPADARPCDKHHRHHDWRAAHAYRVATISSRARHRLSHRRHSYARRHYASFRYGYRYGHGYTHRGYGYRYGYHRYGRTAYLYPHNRYPRYVSYRYRYGYHGHVRPYVRPLALAPFVTRFATVLTLDDALFDGDATTTEKPSYDGIPHARTEPVGSRFLVGGN